MLQGLKRRIEQNAIDITAQGEEVPVPELREVRTLVRRGDTFASILKGLGLSPQEVSRWAAETRSHMSLSRLQPGHAFVFLLPSGTDRLAGLQYELEPDAVLVMREDEDGIAGAVERLPRMVSVKTAAGVIDSSLYAAAVRQGIPDSVISAIVDIFGWDVDFTSDLRPGDRFRVAYEEERIGSADANGGRVLAAEIRVRGKDLEAVYFEADDDGGNYYSREGHPFGRAFLRYPVEFTRITSQFASSRFHPILGVHRPHFGVDLAAPIGTPIRAIAAGRIEFAGWKGGSGRHIKIDHGYGIESSYSHLKSIKPEIRSGARVQLGQIIGTVGASGLATGPHLHFAFWRNGIYVNPLTVKLPAQPPLGAKYMPDFIRTRNDLLQQLAVIPIEDVPVITAASDSVAVIDPAFIN